MTRSSRDDVDAVLLPIVAVLPVPTLAEGLLHRRRRGCAVDATSGCRMLEE